MISHSQWRRDRWRNVGHWYRRRGVIGNVHAKALGGLTTWRRWSRCDPREDAGGLAESTGASWYGDLDEMLADPAVLVVVIATPSGMHPTRCQAARPASTSSREADAISRRGSRT